LKSLLASGAYPSRAVDDNLADVAAQVAANHTGVQQLRQLVDRQSWPVVKAYMGHIQAAASAKMRLALRGLSSPDATSALQPRHSSLSSRHFSHTDHLDDGSPICARITIEGDERGPVRCSSPT
jgi:5-oxoprolinase (ATP-hydrolysing)